jgi:hypothetical protein
MACISAQNFLSYFGWTRFTASGFFGVGKTAERGQ